MKRKALVFALIISLVISMGVLLSGCGGSDDEGTAGAKAYSLTVVDDQGQAVGMAGTTEAETLKDLLDEQAANDSSFSYEMDDSGMIITVNGLTADYNVDQSYWAIFVNDEYGQYGASEQPVSDGDSFKLEYTKAE